MAGTTMLVGDFLAVCNIQRLVNSVTGDAVCKFLPCPVRFMTLHAVGYISMLIMMADSAVKFAMGTWIIFHLANLCGMTGVTDRDVILAKYNM